MIIVRYIGVCVFLLALISLAVDGTKSLASEELVITSLSEFWQSLHDRSLEALRLQLESVSGFGLETISEAILSLPLWVVFGVLGLLFSWIGRKRTRTSVYIN